MPFVVPVFDFGRPPSLFAATTTSRA